MIKGDVFLEDNDRCWIGVAVAPGVDAANAGETLGPRAIVVAVSNAKSFLGATDALSSLNICSSNARDYGHTPPSQSPSFARVSMQCFVPVTTLLKVDELREERPGNQIWRVKAREK
jgi:hypothetical protein